MNEEVILMTQEEYDRKEAELNEMKGAGQKRVSEKLKEARSFGDLSENAEYDAAKNEQAELEAEILKLEDQLRRAKVVKESEIRNDRVNVGHLVEVEDVESGEKLQFVIVGSTSDPFANPPKVANDAPIGRGLIDKKKGEVVEIPIPDGKLHYKVTGISKYVEKK